ncbi:MAG: NAD(P)-dependent oxidoreductase, partial [Candidatus Brocadiaceae bacterium]
IHEKLPPPFEPKIYDNDSYHVYCLTKLLAERFVLDSGGLVLRLSNVYGPGDESVQAVGEACHRLTEADPGERIEVRQPFKKLVPAYLGDIVKCFIRAAGLRLPAEVSPIFLVASQEHYMREDTLLRAVADALDEIRGTDHVYDIEELPPEEETAFSYDLTKMRTHLLQGEPLTPFSEGVREHLIWLMERAEGRGAAEPAFAIRLREGGA